MSNADRNRQLHSLHEHGNYHNYYAHRQEETRLELLPASLFTGKLLLDLGCNAGQISFDCIKLGATAVIGVDIDEKLIKDAEGLNTNPEICQFLCQDFMSGGEQYFEELYKGKQTPDTVLLLSITKWLHLHQGDAGLMQLFTSLYNLLEDGSALIIEPQEWNNYKKAVKKNKQLRPVFLQLQMRPDFIPELESIGFKLESRIERIESGFSRPLCLWRK